MTEAPSPLAKALEDIIAGRRNGDSLEFYRGLVDFYDVLAAHTAYHDRREHLEDRAIEAEWMLGATKREAAYQRDSARCRAMAGKDFEPGVPLHLYRQHKADVLLICNACTYDRVIPLETMITRLRDRGVGDENTGIRAVALHSTGACPQCGARDWQTRPHFPTRPGQDGLPVR